MKLENPQDQEKGHQRTDRQFRASEDIAAFVMRAETAFEMMQSVDVEQSAHQWSSESETVMDDFALSLAQMLASQSRNDAQMQAVDAFVAKLLDNVLEQKRDRAPYRISSMPINFRRPGDSFQYRIADDEAFDAAFSPFISRDKKTTKTDRVRMDFPFKKLEI